MKSFHMAVIIQLKFELITAHISWAGERTGKGAENKLLKGRGDLPQ